MSSDPIDRRRALKRLAFRLPMRPLLVFFYWYVVRLGFLDGRAGFAFSSMRASYELFIDLKMLEAERRRARHSGLMSRTASHRSMACSLEY